MTEELFKDKDRIGRTLKKDAPQIYRKLQLDIFTELHIYKKKTLADMKQRLYQSALRNLGRFKVNQDVQTYLRDVKNNVIK